MPRSGIARSYGISIFNFLQYFIAAFHRGCIILSSHQQYTSVAISPHPCQHLSCLFFFNIILTDMMWYLVVVLICISQIISDADHLSMCLLAIFMFSLRKSLFESFSPFLNWVIRVYLLVNCGVLCIFWKLTPYQIQGFASVFSHFVGCLLLCWLFTCSTGVFSWTSSY